MMMATLRPECSRCLAVCAIFVAFMLGSKGLSSAQATTVTPDIESGDELLGADPDNGTAPIMNATNLATSASPTTAVPDIATNITTPDVDITTTNLTMPPLNYTKSTTNIPTSNAPPSTVVTTNGTTYVSTESAINVTTPASPVDFTNGTTYLSTEFATNATTPSFPFVSTDGTTYVGTESATNATTPSFPFVSTDGTTYVGTESATNATTPSFPFVSTDGTTYVSTKSATNATTPLSPVASTNGTTYLSTESATNATTPSPPVTSTNGSAYVSTESTINATTPASPIVSTNRTTYVSTESSINTNASTAPSPAVTTNVTTPGMSSTVSTNKTGQTMPTVQPTSLVKSTEPTIRASTPLLPYPERSLADIDDDDAQKIVTLEIKVTADDTGCDPADTSTCGDFIDKFKTQVEPFYRHISGFLEIRIGVLRSGSIIVPHSVVYQYKNMKAEERGLPPEEVYTKTTGPGVEAGSLGDLEVDTCEGCHDPKDETDLCAFTDACLYQTSTCFQGYVYCVSPCTDTTYCTSTESGTCQQKPGKPAECKCLSDDKGNYYGDKCEKYFNMTALIIGLSVCGGFILGIIVAITISRYRRRRRLGGYRQYYTDDMEEEESGYLWNASYTYDPGEDTITGNSKLQFS